MRERPGIAEAAMRSSGFLPRLAAGVLLVNLCVAALAWWSVQQNLGVHHEQAELGTQNLARALESDIAGMIETDEMALLAVLDEYRRQHDSGRIDAAGLNAYIERARARRPEIDAIRIADAQGVLVYGTGVKPAERQSLADRPHFIRLRDDPAAGLVFSKPQVSRVNNKWVIALAHRIAKPDGSFDGMVFAAIPLDYLARTFSSLNIGKDGMVALRDADLALVARYPASGLKDLVIGSKPPSPEMPQMVAAGMEVGSYTSVSHADGIERTISFRKVANYPFYVQVGWASDDYLAATRNEAMDIALLVAAFALITLAAGWLIYQSWKRQRQINHALAESETRWNELFENMSSGVAVYRAEDDGKRFVFSAFNRAAERIEQMPRDEVIGRDVVEVFPGVVELGLLEALRRVWQTGRSERFPLSFYRDGRIHGWRDNFVYKLPGGEIVAIYDDVTERMQAQQALEELNRDFVTLLESSSDFIYLKDRDSRIRFCSQSMAVITGHASWRDMVGKHDFEIFPPETAKIYHEEELPVFRDGVPLLNKTDPYIDAAGNRCWVNTNKWPVFDADGKTVIGLFGISRDITDRVRAEEQVRSSMERLNEAQRIAKVGNWELDLVSGHLFWSDEIFSLFEIDRTQFGASYEAFLNAIHPDDREKVNQAYTRSLETREPYEIAHRLRMADGRIKWVNERCETYYGEQGRAVRSVGTVQDVTERKLIEDALRQSEAYNKLLFSDSRVAMVVIDAATGRYIDCNRAAMEIYGLPSRDALLGLTPLDVSDTRQYDGEESATAVRARIDHALRHGSLTFEWRQRRPNGEVWDARVNLMRLRQGESTYLLFTLEDITEQKRISEELRSKTEALQRSNADLERFAYSVSHDMRQPLRAVSGHLQLLQRSLKDKLDEDERENMNFALEGARRMDSMIVSLLDYSRVGRKTEAKAWLPTRTALDDVLGFLEPMILDTSASVNVTGEWPQIFASRDELTRLFQNLVGNGIKFCEQGKTPQVEIESGVDGGIWRVKVRDHGIGIDPQQIDRLFQFFSRLQARSRYDGTGMGLALCRRIVEHHGGRIWAESEGEGKGSVFVFELPLNVAASEEGESDA
ncbi:MAG TPA: PAS domain S-box protein [Gallionella sp.]|nr:PAS domain S-box protein [Gallionella sp.]